MLHFVLEFHRKFGLPNGHTDVLSQNLDLINFRVKFLEEELRELCEALYVKNDRVEAFDALLDLAYVVYGTALFMGIDPAQWREGFKAVHEANMAKIRAESADQSKRGSSFDVIKPQGWQPPEPKLKEILSWNKPALLKSNP